MQRKHFAESLAKSKCKLLSTVIVPGVDNINLGRIWFAKANVRTIQISEMETYFTCWNILDKQKPGWELKLCLKQWATHIQQKTERELNLGSEQEGASPVCVLNSHDCEGSKLTTRIMGFFDLQKGGKALSMKSCPSRFWVGMAVWGAEEYLTQESEEWGHERIVQKCGETVISKNVKKPLRLVQWKWGQTGKAEGHGNLGVSSPYLCSLRQQWLLIAIWAHCSLTSEPSSGKVRTSSVGSFFNILCSDCSSLQESTFALE